MSHPSVVRIVVEGSGRWVDAAAGAPLLDELRRAGIDLPSDCGGVGTCGECRVRFRSGAPPATVEDGSLFEGPEVAAGWRLACQARPVAAGRIEVPEATEETGLRIVVDAAPDESVPRRTAARPGADDLGLAVDVGTTTVACFLVDGASGRALDVAAFPNPQRAFGADIVSRIVFAHEAPEGLARLREAIVEAIEWHALELCRRRRVRPDRIRRIAAVGNSTMTHLLWGVDPWSLGVAPFEPVFLEAPPRRGAELGFDLLRDATVRLLPGIAGHVGADTVGGLLALGLDVDADGRARLFLDLGTNGEMVLVAGGRAMACSTAAGPAFEGVHISAGMPAVEGAIEHVDLDAGDLGLTVIGEVEPRGVCGSGLADAVAALVGAGLIEPSGRMRPRDALPPSVSPALAGRIREGGRGRAIVLADPARAPVLLTQQDVRQVQLAKAAFRTGIEYLLSEMGVSAEELARVQVAGGFGSHLRPESLVALGVLPASVRAAVRSVGNVAGMGARLALGPDENLEAAARISRWVEHLPLERQPGFMDAFTDQLAFPAP